MQGALSAIRVLDLSRVLAGPYCTMILGDLGAEVIKVENPSGGDDTRQWGPPWAGGESAYFLALNRNKRSLTLNLKAPQARRIVRELATRVDILVENWKVGQAEEWQLDYASLSQLNPGLIYCAITGYGQTGPRRGEPGYAFIIEAEGGIMSITGPVEGPPSKVGVAVVDVVAGQNAAIAILAALQDRQTSGQGQYIDIALLDSQIAWLVNVGSNYLISGARPERYGNAHPNIVPYETFPTSDGWIALGVGNDIQWRRLCRLAGWDDLGSDERFKTNPRRVEQRHALVPTLQERFRRRSTSSWTNLLRGGGVPCAPINAIDEALAQDQVLARGMVTEMPHPTAGNVKFIGSPLKLSRSPTGITRPPPLLGQHTQEVLTEFLGLSQADIERLRDEGVV